MQYYLQLIVITIIKTIPILILFQKPPSLLIDKSAKYVWFVYKYSHALPMFGSNWIYLRFNWLIFNGISSPILLWIRRGTTIVVFGPSLDPSAMALMTDGEIPLTDSTNLLGPSSLVGITPYISYGTASQTAHFSSAAATAAVGPTTTTTPLGGPADGGDYQRRRTRQPKKNANCNRIASHDPGHFKPYINSSQYDNYGFRQSFRHNESGPVPQTRQGS